MEIVIKINDKTKETENNFFIIVAAATGTRQLLINKSFCFPFTDYTSSGFDPQKEKYLFFL